MQRSFQLGLATWSAMALAFAPANAAELHFVGVAGDRSNGALVFGVVTARDSTPTAGSSSQDSNANSGTTAGASSQNGSTQPSGPSNGGTPPPANGSSPGANGGSSGTSGGSAQRPASDASPAGEFEATCLLMDAQGDYHIALLVGSVDAEGVLVLEGAVVFSTNEDAEGASVQIALDFFAGLLLDSPAVSDGPLAGWVQVEMAVETASTSNGDGTTGQGSQDGRPPQAPATGTPVRRR